MDAGRDSGDEPEDGTAESLERKPVRDRENLTGSHVGSQDEPSAVEGKGSFFQQTLTRKMSIQEPKMHKRIILLLFYFVFSSLLSITLAQGGHGYYAPLTISLSWAYLLARLCAYNLVGLLLFYLYYLSTLFILKVFLSRHEKGRGHLALAGFYFLGSAISSVIQWRFRKEPIESSVLFAVISIGIIIIVMSLIGNLRGKSINRAPSVPPPGSERFPHSR